MSRKSDLVSVVIPCYNHGKYIDDAVNSILSQTFKNIEIIIVDDGSDESETMSILHNLDAPNTRVYHKANGGPASARNYGIEKSSGEFILTLDSDDKFAPTFVEKALNVLNNQPTTGMVTCFTKRYCNKHVSYAELEGGDIDNFLIKNQANASLLYRYQCWEEAGGYDEKISGFEDWEFFINVTKRGWTVHSIPEYLFHYRNLNGSRYAIDIQIRPEIIKYIATKHKLVFKENLIDVIYQKELEIQCLKETNQTYKDSKSFKIGSLVLTPVKLIRAIFN